MKQRGGTREASDEPVIRQIGYLLIDAGGQSSRSATLRAVEPLTQQFKFLLVTSNDAYSHFKAHLWRAIRCCLRLA